MSAPEKIKPLTWIYISLALFVLFIILAGLLVFYGTRLQLSVSAYFFLLVVIALLCTGFLSGAMRSRATYNGQAYNGKLYLAGPVVIFIVIVLLGYRFRPTGDAGFLTLTVNVFGPEGKSQPITEGNMRVQFDNDIRIEPITNKGQAVFGKVDPSFKGKKVTIIPEIKRYSIPTGDTSIVLADENFPVIDLMMHTKQQSTVVRGSIVDAGGEIIKDAAINFPEFDATTKSNEFGNFSIELPVEEGSETQIVVMQNNKVRYRNKFTVASSVTIPVGE
jgi:hypothetical protein